MSGAMQIAVVGHTNAGKTSLLRTLTRRGSFGEVSDRPGTTRHVEAVDLVLDGASAVRFFDTPGIEDAVALLDHLNTLDDCPTRPERIRAFLAGPEASRSFEQEAKVLRHMLHVDAAFYVVDCREPVLPKYRAEMEIIGACGRPILPVLNFVRHPQAREREWEASLSDAGLHAFARFDAVAPYTGAEQQLYRSLSVLLPARRAPLQRIVELLEAEARTRHALALRTVASLLVDLVAMRDTLARVDLATPDGKTRAVTPFRQRVVARVRAGVDALLDIHGFRRDEADLAVMPWLDGRWNDDLFTPEALREAGLRMGTGAAIGASVGVVADLAFAGLSLGAGATLGAAVGSALSQGAGRVGRSLSNRVRGRVELSLEDEVVQRVAERLLGLLEALEQRGHAAQHSLSVDTPPPGTSPTASWPRVLGVLRRARAHPEWALDPHHPAAGPARRALTVDEVTRALAVGGGTG